MCQNSKPAAELTHAPVESVAHSCACSKNGTPRPMEVNEEVRWVDASMDMEFPAVPFPSKKIFAATGEELLRQLVRAHHSRLYKSSIAELFNHDPQHFEALVKTIGDYVVEASGGPSYFTGSRGNVCMRTLHFPFTIDEKARRIWLTELRAALDEVQFPESVMEEYWNWMEAFSMRMINRRTTRSQPMRYPFLPTGQTHPAR